MKVDVGGSFEHTINDTVVSLPRFNNGYVLIYEKIDTSTLINATVRVSSSFVMFKMEIDGVEVTEFDVEVLREMTKFGKDDLKPFSPISYNEKRKTIEVSFTNPISFKESMKIYMKASTSNQNREVRGLSIITGRS